MKPKICSKCKEEKEFSISEATKDGLQYQCKECVKEYMKESYKVNPEKRKQNTLKWQTNNPEKYKESAKKGQAKYQAKILQTFWGYWNRRFSIYLYKLIEGIIKTSPTLEWVLGCPSQQIRNHIISQFESDMTIENYGTVWEIDHKISKFLLQYESFDDSNFRKLWCLENLRPLWKEDNRKKGKNEAL